MTVVHPVGATSDAWTHPVVCGYQNRHYYDRLCVLILSHRSL